MSYKAGIYDVYDDGGRLLLEIYGSPEGIPEFLKTASVDVDQNTPSNLFALVMVEGETILRKYAMADRANTAASVIYFSKTKDNLPVEAQKVAAANLLHACTHYGMAPPVFLVKLADNANPESNVVDVTGVHPPPKMAQPDDRKPVRYAIERADGSSYYPLEGPSSIKVADQYFQRNVTQFVPRERREFAVKVAAVAEEFDYPVSELVENYASDAYSPDLRSWLTARAVYVYDGKARTALAKLASVAGQVPPDEFASALEVFDRATGIDKLWDSKVPDPWFCTFNKVPQPGMSKIAKGNSLPTATFNGGGTRVTSEDLVALSERGISTLAAHFGEDFTNRFIADPLTQFQGMSLPHKKLIARLATEIIGAGH